MAINGKITKPHINVFYHKETVKPESFNHVIWGIEEEGIPYIIEEKSEETALELGYLGAEASNLGVGIGIGKDGLLILHYNKLQKDHPLFRIKLKDSAETLRKIGANAARLVKGIPFKTI